MKKSFQMIIIIILFATTASSISSPIFSSTGTDTVGGNILTDNITNSSDSAAADKVRVIASFYPIFEFVKKVGGDRVDVSSLVPVGIEPHDFEPTIQQIQNAERADMIVFNGAGFEGERLKNINAKVVLDTSDGLNLDQSNKGLLDPHIWLDPLLAKQQVEKIRDGLVRIDPSNAEYYHANANNFTSALDDLDMNIRTELSNCEKKDFITFHKAFVYFSNRYNLTEHGIHASSPEGDISAQRIQQVIGLALDMELATIYSEELTDPRLAEVIAQEIPDGKVLTLSPIEGIGKEEQNAGRGYIDKMNENIENLRIGLKCK